MRTFCGIDNGVSGHIGIIRPDGTYLYYKTPTKKELSYTKKKQYTNRIDVPKFINVLKQEKNAVILFERPMINPGRWKATLSATRALEATLIVFEILKLSYAYCDSKEWQKALLPSGLKKEELKVASLDVAKRMFPAIAEQLDKQPKNHRDGDAILIAEYLRRTYA